MKKTLAIILIIWPYLPWFYKGGYSGALENFKLFIGYEVLSAILIVINIINIKSWDNPKELFFYYMVLGVVHFPYYLIGGSLALYMGLVAWITNMKELAIKLTIGVLLIAGLFVTKNLFRNAAVDKALMMGVLTEQDLEFENVLLGSGIGDLVLYFKIKRGM